MWRERGEGSEVSYWQSRCSDTIDDDATVRVERLVAAAAAWKLKAPRYTRFAGPSRLHGMRPHAREPDGYPDWVGCRLLRDRGRPA